MFDELRQLDELHPNPAGGAAWVCRCVALAWHLAVLALVHFPGGSQRADYQRAPKPAADVGLAGVGVREVPQDPDFQLTLMLRREGSSPAFSAGWTHDKVWSYTCSDSYHETVIAASAASAALPLFHVVLLACP
jgi:hypothetical protein